MLKRRETRPNPTPPDSDADVAPEDWDLLFRAVQARLLESVDNPSWAPLEDVRARVHECVEALDRLHATAMHRFQQGGLQVMGDVSAASSTPRPQTVLCVGLEGLKAVDDGLEQGAGDSLRSLVGTRLARAVRAGDMVARLDSDTFACLLVDAPGRHRLSHLADSLFDSLSAPFHLGTARLLLRPSIGIALRPEGGPDTEALLRNANTAMQRARIMRVEHAFFNGP